MRSFRGPCKKLRFEICEYNFIDRFKLKITQRTYFIRPKSCLQNCLQNLCSSCLHAKHVVNNIQLVRKIFDQAQQLQMCPQKVFERQKS